MKRLVLVGVILAFCWAPPFLLAQTTGGGATGSKATGGGTKGGGPNGSDVKGTEAQPPSPGSVPYGQSGPPTPSMSDKPITKADCQRLGGTWSEARMSCTLIFR